MCTPHRQRHAVLAGLLALMLSGCGPSPKAEEAEPPVRVSALTLEPVELTVHEDLPGRVAALRTAEIRPQVSGIVQKRLFEQGAEIKAGAPLFQIDPAAFKADAETAAGALQRAQAVLARAHLQADRLAPLVQADAVSRQVFDDAQSQRAQAAAEVAQAQAALARRQLDLRFATVDAPISGRIDQALVSEGALVTPANSMPMATIQQIDQVYVDVRQSAASLEQLRHAVDGRQSAGSGMPVQILAGSDKPLGTSGRLLFSGINVDAGTGDVLLRVLVDNRQRQLLPGMYVLARVPRAHYPAALTVPQEAVRHRGGRASVWVVDEHQHARQAAVELGELVNRHYRIASGLEAGQQVVIQGLERLDEGKPVEAHAWQNPTTAGAADLASR
ncbi:efflux RND transporter periplasmic adaptor subunit [Hydrogenophaga palleronii]|uniref:efflux RND transporter periplasmic adaptor subunit n=1 Tax=Hydrogenophaga palleronii TaxID=65655 RepID=UPI0008267AB8|nr:efflux RND transporter periplasmic adaptor subunit [Hydrogenophaga palleronii]